MINPAVEAQQVADGLLEKLRTKQLDKVGIEEIRDAIESTETIQTNQMSWDAFEGLVVRKVVSGA